MVYNYLLNLYKVLDERKKDIEIQISQLSDNSGKLEYQKGRLKSISEFRSFLKTHYHTKLPRRIQKQLE